MSKTSIFGILVLFVLIAFYLSPFTTNKELIEGAWSIEQAYLKDESIMEDLNEYFISFSTIDNKLIVPSYKKRPISYIKKRGDWKLKTIGFNNPVVELCCTEQAYFDGIYKIEVLDHSLPMYIRLYSDSITFYLRELSFHTNGESVSFN